VSTFTRQLGTLLPAEHPSALACLDTGLKYLESLIALELRQKLTKHAHQQYLKSNNFYKYVP
jgi:ABC-type uncharacterized transport system fused permease/ATPase subunit